MGSMEENEDDEESDPEEELDEEYEYEVFPEDVVPVTVGFGASPGGTCAPYSGTFTVAPSAAPAAIGASAVAALGAQEVGERRGGEEWSSEGRSRWSRCQ